MKYLPFGVKQQTIINQPKNISCY